MPKREFEFNHPVPPQFMPDKCFIFRIAITLVNGSKRSSAKTSFRGFHFVLLFLLFQVQIRESWMQPRFTDRVPKELPSRIR